jgi:hypothetical protein
MKKVIKMSNAKRDKIIGILRKHISIDISEELVDDLEDYVDSVYWDGRHMEAHIRGSG